MCSLFVRSHSFRCAVDLNKNKARGIVLLLDHVEARNARLLDACAGILKGDPPELRDRFRLNAHMHVDNEHRISPSLLSYRRTSDGFPRLDCSERLVATVIPVIAMVAVIMIVVVVIVVFPVAMPAVPGVVFAAAIVITVPPVAASIVCLVPAEAIERPFSALW
jgi:hypothetical protein